MKARRSLALIPDGRLRAVSEPVAPRAADLAASRVNPDVLPAGQYSEPVPVNEAIILPSVNSQASAMVPPPRLNGFSSAGLAQSRSQGGSQSVN